MAPCGAVQTARRRATPLTRMVQAPEPAFPFSVRGRDAVQLPCNSVTAGQRLDGTRQDASALPAAFGACQGTCQGLQHATSSCSRNGSSSLTLGSGLRNPNLLGAQHSSLHGNLKHFMYNLMGSRISCSKAVLLQKMVCLLASPPARQMHLPCLSWLGDFPQLVNCLIGYTTTIA